MARKTTSKKIENATWVTVPVDDALHREVRAQAVRQRKDWPSVVAEAMRLWLAAQATYRAA